MESYSLEKQQRKAQKSKFLRLVIAGFAATLAFNGVMYYDISVTGIPLDIPTTLGQLTVGDSPISPIVGHTIHFLNGIGLALLFGYVVVPISKKITKMPIIAYAVAFAGIETIFGVWFGMLPALGAGFAGLDISPQVPAITMTRHIVFGLVLGAFATQWRKIQ
ncbi:MAG: DUF6789 family protein [Nitrosopumilaceae archaeon]